MAQVITLDELSAEDELYLDYTKPLSPHAFHKHLKDLGSGKDRLGALEKLLEIPADEICWGPFWPLACEQLAGCLQVDDITIRHCTLQWLGLLAQEVVGVSPTHTAELLMLTLRHLQKWQWNLQAPGELLLSVLCLAVQDPQSGANVFPVVLKLLLALGHQWQLLGEDLQVACTRGVLALLGAAYGVEVEVPLVLPKDEGMDALGGVWGPSPGCSPLPDEEPWPGAWRPSEGDLFQCSGTADKAQDKLVLLGPTEDSAGVDSKVGGRVKSVEWEDKEEVEVQCRAQRSGEEPCRSLWSDESGSGRTLQPLLEGPEETHEGQAVPQVLVASTSAPPLALPDDATYRDSNGSFADLTEEELLRRSGTPAQKSGRPSSSRGRSKTPRPPLRPKSSLSQSAPATPVPTVHSPLEVMEVMLDVSASLAASGDMESCQNVCIHTIDMLLVLDPQVEWCRRLFSLAPCCRCLCQDVYLAPILQQMVLTTREIANMQESVQDVPVASLRLLLSCHLMSTLAASRSLQQVLDSYLILGQHTDKEGGWVHAVGGHPIAARGPMVGSGQRQGEGISSDVDGVLGVPPPLTLSDPDVGETTGRTETNCAELPDGPHRCPSGSWAAGCRKPASVLRGEPNRSPIADRGISTSDLHNPDWLLVHLSLLSWCLRRWLQVRESAVMEEKMANVELRSYGESKERDQQVANVPDIQSPMTVTEAPAPDSLGNGERTVPVDALPDDVHFTVGRGESSPPRWGKEGCAHVEDPVDASWMTRGPLDPFQVPMSGQLMGLLNCHFLQHALVLCRGVMYVVEERQDLMGKQEVHHMLQEVAHMIQTASLHDIVPPELRLVKDLVLHPN